MGVGGNFWELLKPYARNEGFDYLRDKRVAVDLSFWIVQHQTAIKSRVRNPHIRLTFFRTINLFAKFGSLPVFVVDGTPSPLKSQARIARFFCSSGIDVSSLPEAGEGGSVKRNQAFIKCVQECVELLELLGMPILKAKGEAEALCAQLNREGFVDACLTADSDAFLFGAKCVIKFLRPDSMEPFECYHMSDIETGLGLKRRHLIAISLLVGNDHDLNGVQGIGLATALRFVQSFSEDEILDRLREIGNGETPFHTEKLVEDILPSLDESSQVTKFSHCSLCGHPGSKRAHLTFSCKLCITDNGEGCVKKPDGFKCDCSSCDMDRKAKEHKQNENMKIKVCNKIVMEPNFPNDEICKMYLCNCHGDFTVYEGPSVSWKSPNTEMLVDYLVFHQNWQPSYIRQRMLPILSTIYLRERASDGATTTLLYGQYEFDSVLNVKVRYGHQFYVVKWKKATRALSNVVHVIPSEESNMQQEEVSEVDESIDMLDESNDTQIHVDDGGCYLLTNESMELVHAAFPEEVYRFLQAKEMKELKRRKSSSLRCEETSEKSESPKSRSVQLNITEFYRSTKVQGQAKPGVDVTKISDNRDDGTTSGKRKVSSPNLPKSVRRRLLFD